MHKSRLTDIQNINLQILQVIREGLLADREGTRHMFQLTVEQADRIGAMTHAELTQFALNARDLSLFIPRSNLVELLSAPPAMVSLLGSIRPVRQRGAGRNPGRRREDYPHSVRDAG